MLFLLSSHKTDSTQINQRRSINNAENHFAIKIIYSSQSVMQKRRSFNSLKFKLFKLFSKLLSNTHLPGLCRDPAGVHCIISKWFGRESLSGNHCQSKLVGVQGASRSDASLLKSVRLIIQNMNKLERQGIKVSKKRQLSETKF